MRFAFNFLKQLPLILSTAFGLTLVSHLHAAKPKPNVVFILADDLGWSDTEIYGTTQYFKTPNILRLAQRGMRFTQAYTPSPICSPTRSSIMTGLHHARIGFTDAVGHHKPERLNVGHVQDAMTDQRAIQILSATRLETHYYSLAEAFNTAGYQTGHYGKWHLGMRPYHALAHGFNEQVPQFPEGAVTKGFLAPWPSLVKEGFTGEPGEHIEDRMAKEAVAFIRKSAKKGKPFFLNYWAYSVHSPWSAKPALTRHYEKSYREFDGQRNPVYAAMIHSLDDAVGTLMNELERLDIMDNTIIIFYSDNGGNTWPPVKTEPEGYDNVPGTSNYPLRQGKGWYYEGGVRVPLVIAWPDHIKANSRSDAFVSAEDFFPTFVDMLGLEPPKNYRFDGQSFSSVLNNKPADKEKIIYGYYPHYSFFNLIKPAIWVRKGDWKLIRFFHDAPGQKHRHELFNLKKDIGEAYDIAFRFPEEQARLSRLIDQFIEEKQVLLPQLNPKYQLQ